MTLSPKVQRAERQRLLSGMADALGDLAFDQLYFVVGRDFPEVHLTAWLELKQEALVEPRNVMTEYRFRLTPLGWFECQRAAGLLESADVMDRCVKLMQALKGVADRAAPNGLNDAFLGWDADPILQTGIPLGWAFSALRSPLLRRMFPKHRVNHRYEFGKRYFRVPINFGRKIQSEPDS